jgi:hypothetical protein
LGIAVGLGRGCDHGRTICIGRAIFHHRAAHRGRRDNVATTTAIARVTTAAHGVRGRAGWAAIGLRGWGSTATTGREGRKKRQHQEPAHGWLPPQKAWCPTGEAVGQATLPHARRCANATRCFF